MDELEISGRRYLSTRRAGKDHKYHADYIGQLIRAKKVEGKKVGRAWYVDADSLDAYLDLPAHAPVARHVASKQNDEAPLEITMPIVVDKEESELPMSESDAGVEEKNEEKIQTIPIYRTTHEAREANRSLRYVAEDGPLIPHIQNIHERIHDERVVAMRHSEPQPIPVKLESFKPIHPIAFEQPQPLPQPQLQPLPTKKRNAAPLAVRIGAVAMLGVAVFLIAGILSDHLFFTLTVDGEQSASVGYLIK